MNANTCAMCPWYYRHSYHDSDNQVVWDHDCQATVPSTPLATATTRHPFPEPLLWCKRAELKKARGEA